MKKTAAVLAAAIISIMSVLPAGAENVNPPQPPVSEVQQTEGAFQEFTGVVFSFSSGVGGWSTEMMINADGSFIGNFHDSEMGDTGEGYPEGSFFLCSFKGRFVIDENGMLKVEELECDEPEGEEIIDGLRYVHVAAPYGLSKGAAFRLYRPGANLEALSEQERFWFHMNDEGIPADFFGLYDAENDCGFRGDFIFE